MQISSPGQVSLGVVCKACAALRDAEVVRFALICDLSGGERLVDPHATDWVGHHVLRLVRVGCFQTEVRIHEVEDLGLDPGGDFVFVHLVKGHRQLVPALHREENWKDL